MSKAELTEWDEIFAACGVAPDAPHRRAVVCFAAVQMAQLAALVDHAGVAEALGAAEMLGGFQAVRDFVRGGGLPGAMVDQYGEIVMDYRPRDVAHLGVVA